MFVYCDCAKPRSTCVGGANLAARSRPGQSGYLKLSFSLGIRPSSEKGKRKKERKKEFFKSSSSRSLQKQNLISRKQERNLRSNIMINTLALLAILAAATLHQVGSAPLENETQERSNICGGVSGEFWERWFIFSTACGAVLFNALQLTPLTVL